MTVNPTPAQPPAPDMGADRSARAGQLMALGELAPEVAHEANNLLTGIFSYAGLLEKTASPAQRPRIQGILNNGQRIAALLARLLTFARPDPERVPAAPRALIQSTLALLERRLQRSAVEVLTHLPGELPTLECNPRQLEQVLVNLLLNAIDALDERYAGEHPEKTIKISVFSITRGESSRLCVVVEDQGIGIPTALVDQVVEPYFSTKTPGQGTGLGLTISRRIVEDHGGTMGLESIPGRFTRVTLELPLQS